MATALREGPSITCDGVVLDVTAHELPIAPRVGPDVLWPLWQRGGYDRWLGLGQAGGRAEICTERTAVNLLRYRRGAFGLDADESDADGAPLMPGAPEHIVATANVEALVAAIHATGTPARISDSAGTFLCNQVLYVMEAQLAGCARSGCGAFLHLPYLPEQVAHKPAGTPALPLDVQVRAVRAALVALCRK